ncbi:MAG: FAD-dependent oxidoreductase [Flavobacteriaceae bacterium]
MFDALIIGGGVAGMQCALVLGSGLKKPYAENKKIGVIMHQRSSHLQNALFNNVLSLPSGTLGSDVLIAGKKQLTTKYPDVTQIEDEKVISITIQNHFHIVKTNKNEYKTQVIVLALNYAKPFLIKGLDAYLEPHQSAKASKDRIQLRNENYLVTENVYVCGTLSGCRSQFAIAAGSGATVATDILTLWNNGEHSQVHDKI